MTVRNRIWIAGLSLLVLLQVAFSLCAPRGRMLTEASDWIQAALLLAAVAAFLPNIWRSTNHRTRFFWSSMSAGVLLWATYHGLWCYFEVIKHTDVPDLFPGDVILFLHLVPMITALAIRPHLQEEHNESIGYLDFSLLLTWWIFLYVYAVLPWQYVVPNVAAYNATFNIVYLSEKTVLMVVLILLVITTNGGWRRLYGQLLGASALYALSSYVANWAIGRQTFYSGSIYDVPLTVSMAWTVVVGRFASHYDLAPARRSSPLLGVWLTRCGMVAVSSLPWFALRPIFDLRAPASVRAFRIILSLLTMVAMGSMVFLRQRLLGNELAYLIDASRHSLDDLKSLQAQLLQSEKLASLGRLVGGAAHELNNPLAAMLGYSDLLSASNLPPAEERLAQRIGEQVRRTKSLVANLLTFAQQTPAKLFPLDLRSLLQTVLQISESQLRAQETAVRLEIDDSLAPVLADSNQLLHVCLHLAGRAALPRPVMPGHELLIRMRNGNGVVFLEFTCAGTADPRAYTPITGTGSDSATGTSSLRACLRIIQEHHGRILSRVTGDNLAFLLELPVAQNAIDYSARASRGTPRLQ